MVVDRERAALVAARSDAYVLRYDYGPTMASASQPLLGWVTFSGDLS
jgi:hypothetical protein